MMKKTLILGAFVALFLTASAQEDIEQTPTDTLPTEKDYIVTLKGDTLKGDIRSQTQKGVRFKKKGNKKFEKIPASEIQSFFIFWGTTRYVYKDLRSNGDLLLSEVLEEGSIILYEIRTYTNTYTPTIPLGTGISIGSGIVRSGNIVWFAEKQEGGKIIEINSYSGNKEGRKNLFMNFIADQPFLVDRLNKEKFNVELVRSLIKEYNLAASSKKSTSF